jgi:hypothetical protein
MIWRSADAFSSVDASGRNRWERLALMIDHDESSCAARRTEVGSGRCFETAIVKLSSFEPRHVIFRTVLCRMYSNDILLRQPA